MAETPRQKPTQSHRAIVLHIAPTPFFSDRGCHIRIEGIAKSLEKLGYDNLVCTYHHGRDIDGIRTSRISPIKNYTQTEAGPSKYKLWADWKLLWRVFKDVRRYQPTVLHAHLHEGLAIGLVVKILLFWRKLPMIADMQGSLTGELEQHGAYKEKPWLKPIVRLCEKVLLTSAKTIICSSEHAKNLFQSEFNIKSTKLTLVQDGAQIPDTLNSNQISRLKQKFNLPVDKTIVVYSGALLESKGLVELKSLMASTEQNDSVHFLIIGYPEANLTEFLKQHSLEQKCTLLGRIPFEQLPSLLQLADLGVDPKANNAGEGSGKMLNYLAASLPVLAFNTVNNQAFVARSNKLASNPTEMIDLLNTWALNSALLKKIGQDNFSHFQKRHSWDITVQQLAKVYEDT